MVTWAGVISGLSKQSKRGMPYAQQAYQLWKELESTGLQAGNPSAHAAGRYALHAAFELFLSLRLSCHRSPKSYRGLNQAGVRLLGACNVP